MAELAHREGAAGGVAEVVRVLSVAAAGADCNRAKVGDDCLRSWAPDAQWEAGSVPEERFLIPEKRSSLICEAREYPAENIYARLL